MRFDPRLRVSYPTLTACLRIRLPAVRNVRRTWTAFLKYGGLPEREAEQVLRVGPDPVLELATGGRFRGYPASEADAMFTASNPGKIFLNPASCRAWAANLHDGRYIRHLEASILQELCHWGEHRNPAAFEEGIAFEAEAYGRRVERPWLPLAVPAVW